MTGANDANNEEPPVSFLQRLQRLRLALSAYVADLVTLPGTFQVGAARRRMHALAPRMLF